MVPSMYSVMESDVFPPDVCYSGDMDRPSSPSPPEWERRGNEPQEIGMESESDNSNAAQLHSPVVEMEDGNVNEMLEGAVGGDLEGAVGGDLEGAVGLELPDLCNTGYKISSTDLEQFGISCNSVEETDQSHVSSGNITNDAPLQVKIVDSSTLTLQEGSCVPLDVNQTENELCGNASNSGENYLFNHYKCINVVPCETGNIENKLHIILEDKNISSSSRSPPTYSETQSSESCDMFGALEKDEELNLVHYQYTLDLVRRNILQSSHPSYHEWKCTALIPGYFLVPVSLHSHGTSLGYDTGSSFFLGSSSAARSSSVDDDSQQASEDEQIKLAKRFDLIRHLPCGVVDGSTKTRECVICMIDFTVGDRVRYLPCMHTYHTDCIDDWLVRSFTCPSCLEPVDAALLSTYETT